MPNYIYFPSQKIIINLRQVIKIEVIDETDVDFWTTDDGIITIRGASLEKILGLLTAVTPTVTYEIEIVNE